MTALKLDFPYHIREEKLEMEVYSKLPLLNAETIVYGSCRRLITADIQIGDRSVKFIAPHAYPQLYWGHGGWKIRNQHLRGMAKYVKYLQQPAIVMGDLNVSMWSPYYH